MDGGNIINVADYKRMLWLILKKAKAPMMAKSAFLTHCTKEMPL
jgi:hypothetical protein